MNDQQRNKGDFWIFDLRHTLRFKKSKKVVVHNGGNDGWRIKPIITILRFSHSDYSFENLSVCVVWSRDVLDTDRTRVYFVYSRPPLAPRFT